MVNIPKKVKVYGMENKPSKILKIKGFRVSEICYHFGDNTLSPFRALDEALEICS